MACTVADGTAVAEVDGAEVACGAVVGELEPLDDGVAVAEDPQANNRATKSRTIALGRCLVNIGLDLDIGTAP